MPNPDTDKGLEQFQSLLQQARASLQKAAKPKNRLLSAAEDAAAEYRDVYQHERYIARYWKQTCRRCESTQSGLEGLYEQRVHPRTSARITKRLVDEPLILEALASRITFDYSPPEVIPVCEACLILREENNAKAA